MASFERSYLFVPGNRPERFAKACESEADTVIVDLEDAVPPDSKSQARRMVAEWLSPQRRVCIRINGVDTPWFDEDCALLRLAGVSLVMLPKAESADVVAHLNSRSGGKPILPLVETAQGFQNAQAIAKAPGTQRLVFGSIDFQLDLGISGDGEELLFFRSGLVLASRLAGLPAPVDGVSTAIEDSQAVAAEAARAHRLGFGGKLCIHPKQLAVVNAAFTPSAAEVDWGRRVLAAAASAGGAAIAVDGKMVDRPVILRAQRIIEQAEVHG